MNSSKLNDSRLNNSQIDYAELDVSKIREFIKILEEHQDKCEKSGRFVEAEMAKQRVVQFRKVEEEKLLNDTKRTHEEQRILLERDQKDELDRFNERWDQEFYEMSGRFNEQESKIREVQEREIAEKLEDFEKNYPQTPKPTVDILNLNKVLEQAVKQKEAHQIQVQIAEHTDIDNLKFLEEKERKIRKEAEKIKTKQDNEMNSFNMKTQAAYNEFKKNRAIEFDKQILRYKNRTKELESNQKLEICNFSKILKGISSKGYIFNKIGPNSRISNIMKSASNIHNMQSSPSTFNKNNAI